MTKKTKEGALDAETTAIIIAFHAFFGSTPKQTAEAIKMLEKRAAKAKV